MRDVASPELRALIDSQEREVLRQLLRAKPDGPKDAESIERMVEAILERLDQGGGT